MNTAIATRSDDPQDRVVQTNAISRTSEAFINKNSVAGQTGTADLLRTLTIHRRFESAFTQLASYW